MCYGWSHYWSQGTDFIARMREADVTRTILTLAVALFGASTLFGSAAEACISCEYVPEVVNTPTKQTYKAKRHQKKTLSVARSKAAPAKKRVGKSESVAKVERPAKTEAAPAAKTDVAKTETESTPRLTGSSALIQTSVPPAPTVTAVADDEGGACKKFFPTVGKALSVPCE
jgi:hypothetical protein